MLLRDLRRSRCDMRCAPFPAWFSRRALFTEDFGEGSPRGNELLTVMMDYLLGNVIKKFRRQFLPFPFYGAFRCARASRGPLRFLLSSREKLPWMHGSERAKQMFRKNGPRFCAGNPLDWWVGFSFSRTFNMFNPFKVRRGKRTAVDGSTVREHDTGSPPSALSHSRQFLSFCLRKILFFHQMTFLLRAASRTSSLVSRPLPSHALSSSSP